MAGCRNDKPLRHPAIFYICIFPSKRALLRPGFPEGTKPFCLSLELEASSEDDWKLVGTRIKSCTLK